MNILIAPSTEVQVTVEAGHTASALITLATDGRLDGVITFGIGHRGAGVLPPMPHSRNRS